jgi:hypothetical protein
MARPFFETLRELRMGRTLEDLSDELAKALVAVKSTGKAATLTLKLKIKPPKSGVVSYVTIEDDIDTKIPKLDRGDTVFYPTADNGLSRHDPAQSQLPFGKVDTATGEIKVEEGSAA